MGGGGLKSEQEGLRESIDNLGGALLSVSSGLQVKIGVSTEKLENALEMSSSRLLAGLETAAAAANRAAAASAKHARNLAWATWALVAATFVLAMGPALEHFLPTQTARQRECGDVAAYIAAQVPQPGKGPWEVAPIVGAPEAPWSGHAEAVATYFRCLGRR